MSSTARNLRSQQVHHRGEGRCRVRQVRKEEPGVDEIEPLGDLGVARGIASTMRNSTLVRPDAVASWRAISSCGSSMSMPTTVAGSANSASWTVTSPPPQPTSRHRHPEATPPRASNWAVVWLDDTGEHTKAIPPLRAPTDHVVLLECPHQSLGGSARPVSNRGAIRARLSPPIARRSQNNPSPTAWMIKPASPPTTVPLMRMNWRSRPTCSSIRRAVSRPSQRWTVVAMRSATSLR